ncbi:RagB/SusD family nutrient uptake outer membrane protein [Flavitalea sp.]|nr:RagB/SusD family nutrient uptake outer membrane protein [Flavitalea sp.]
MSGRISYCAFLLIFLVGCQKFLDKKADKSRFILSKVSELQGLFDNANTYAQNPVSDLLASDDLYFTTENYNSIFSQLAKEIYSWNPNANLSQEWAFCYQRIFRMNVILEETEKLSSEGNDRALSEIKGSALFVRALAHFMVAQLFAPYSSFDGPDNEFGIPLKLTADIESVTTRATLKQSYKTIIDELKISAGLLPDTGLFKTRPGKAAAYGLLAKIYLSQGDYQSAEKYSDSSLQIYKALMDYNDQTQVNINAESPFKIMNNEVTYHSTSDYGLHMENCYVDSTLVSLYDSNDLRKSTFFAKQGSAYRFKGSYAGTSVTISFTGLSTNETFLIRSESRARNGNIVGAMEDLNSLLVKRWKSARFVPRIATTQSEVIKTILTERRKELCFRPGVRWTDLRRFNVDGQYAISLTRVINGNRTDLPPGDPRYTFLIPTAVVLQNQISQNPR